MQALESVSGLRDDLGRYSEHAGAFLGFLSGETQPAICLPWSVLWIYEILSIKYPAHIRHIADAPKTEAIILLSGEENGNPLQYSCLENPMDRGAWRATVHGVAKSWTQLSDLITILLRDSASLMLKSQVILGSNSASSLSHWVNLGLFIPLLTKYPARKVDFTIHSAFYGFWQGSLRSPWSNLKVWSTVRPFFCLHSKNKGRKKEGKNPKPMFPDLQRY